MSMKKFIAKNRNAIDRLILKINPNNPRINDREREFWISNNEMIYGWVKRELRRN